MRENLVASFWIRLLARLIDLIIFAIASLLIAYANISLNNKIQFIKSINFYIWSLSSIIFLILLFLIIPWVSKGYTIGMYVCKIKIIFLSKNIFKNLFIREIMFSVMWIFNLILLSIIINHTMINKVLQKTLSNTISIWENFRIAIYGSINSIAFLIQWIFAISIIIRKNNEGFHDKFSKTKTIFTKKYIIINNKNKKIISFKPYLVENKKIEWVGGD